MVDRSERQGVGTEVPGGNRSRRARASTAARRAEAISRVALALAGPLDLQDVFQRGVNTVVAALGAAGAMAHLADEASGELHLSVSVGYTAQTVAEMSCLRLDGPTFTAWVARERQEYVVRVSDADAAPSAMSRGIIVREHLRYSLLLPLLAQDTLVGTLAIKFEGDRVVSPRVRETARAVAALLAVAVRNARLYQDLASSTFQADALERVAQELGGNLDPTRVLHLAADAARTLVNADIAMTAVPQPDGSLKVVGLSGARSPLTEGLIIPPNYGLTAQVLRSGAPMQTEDYLAEPGYERNPSLDASARAEGLRSFIQVPVPGPGGPISTIWAASRTERRFTDDEARLLGQLASLVSVAVQNARLHDAEARRADEAAALERTGRLLAASLHLDTTLSLIARAAAELSAADGGAILLVRPDGDSLEYRVGYGQQADSLQGRMVPSNSGVSIRALRSRRPVRVEDVEGGAGCPLGVGALLNPNPRSLLAAPLLSGSEALGVVTVWHRDPRRFGAPEERLLAMFADQAALAVERAHLYADSRRREQEASLLAEVSALLHAGYECPVVLADVCRLVGTAMGASCAVVTGSNASGGLQLAATHNVTPQTLAQLETAVASLGGWEDAGLNRRMMETGQPALLLDGQQPARLTWPRWFPLESCVGVPIAVSAGLLGLLYVWTPRGGPRLDEAHLRVLALLADRLSAAFENAALVRDAAQVAALRELDRLRSELLDTVSHELRTPLSLIFGFSELMASPSTNHRFSREDMVKMSEHVHSGALTMSRLVDDLLEYARLERGNLFLSVRPLRLEELLQGTLRSFSSQPEGDRLRLTLDSGLDTVDADEARLRQVIGNLISNALKYAPGGEIELRAYYSQAQVMIDVVDHGSGISDEEKPRVWDKFFRGQARLRGIRGSGIGLSVVRALVEAHGGQVSLTDTPGDGATFRVSLPDRRAPNGDPDATPSEVVGTPRDAVRLA